MGYPTRSSEGLPQQPKPREWAPQFGFVERQSGNRSRDQEVLSLERGRDLDPIKLAEQFVNVRLTDRQGRSRTEESKMQGVLTRALYAGRLGQDFFPAFRREVIRRVGLRNGNNTEADWGDGHMDVGLYTATIERGIRNAVEAIRILEATFSKETRPADMRQAIGTNEVLDAMHQIDLVEIRYQERAEGTDIRVVRLVQVKGGAKSLTEDERADIQAAHLRYVERLQDVGAYTEEQHKKAESYVSGGAYFRREIERRQDKAVDLHTFLVAYFEELVVDLLAAETLDDATFEAAFAGLSDASCVIAKVFFAQPKSGQLLYQIADGVGESIEKARAAFGAIQEWVLRHPPTVEELRGLDPERRLDPEALAVTRFESVLIEGGVIHPAVPLEPRFGTLPKVLKKK